MLLSASLLAFVSSVLAAAGPGHAGELSRRAAPDSPSGSYPPANVDCPSTRPTIRAADSLSQAERDWLRERRPKTVQPMIDLLRRGNIPDFDAEGFINNHANNFSVIPNIGIAVSGGGYRALMNGAGFIAAADSREAGSTGAGQIGGLLQAATYVSALSGGGWLVGSIYANNYTTVTRLRDGSPDSSVWKFEDSILGGPDEPGVSILNTAGYWSDLVDNVDDKRDAGYAVSLTDPWGRALSYQLINATQGGPAYTLSSIANDERFANADTPFPIIVTVERAPGNDNLALNNSVVEFNPYEMGTFDPTFYGFAPTRYLGSQFNRGEINSTGHCVRGLDQLGFVMGTSSSLFNYALIELTNSNGESEVPTVVLNMVEGILETISGESNDVAVWEPNPFRGYHPGINRNANRESLILVDGGMALENIPLQPVIQPMRAVDVVFAVDSSADTEYYWPNGTALRATYERSKQDVANGTNFPAVPGANTFINLGLNRRPTFFGCDVSEFRGGHVPPLIVYVPNAPYTINSNISTFQMSTEVEEKLRIIQNGWNVATMGNDTVESDWTTCLSCAVLSRSLQRTGTTIPAACNTCFQRHCWNGTENEATPTAEPTFIIGDAAATANPQNAGVTLRTSSMSLAVAVLAALFLA
ncbi:lysophospholipase-like protein [Microdochium trichocladiopsis]|uniref:Lysophospholipase n=1 Tax=Microdochium trichocladiopsis TaxID=1682393 RepID=A0A9P8Y4X9_9PEZI|nr:lysophospholipase-like protein [Microdochium trichocladiopsis]KAH7027695.1 lysophospholipase-like protein [Microdochium trichocladiopsis]